MKILSYRQEFSDAVPVVVSANLGRTFYTETIHESLGKALLIFAVVNRVKTIFK